MNAIYIAFSVIRNGYFHYLLTGIIRLPKDKSGWHFSAQHLEALYPDCIDTYYPTTQ